MKSLIVKPYAKYISRQVRRDRERPIEDQKKVFDHLLSVGKETLFGRDHSFGKISSYEDWCEAIPIRDYEGLRPYVDKILEGQPNILWKGRPRYFAKTSGTTSGTKYIPITSDSMPNHMVTARRALMTYACLLYTSPSPRDQRGSRMPSSA